MKALIIADDKIAIERFSAVLKTSGYDVIVYHWLLKAIDNIEEISPHIIIVSALEYPRHWKTLAQYANSGICEANPRIILFTESDFPLEEQKKAEQLGVLDSFSYYNDEGLEKLRYILKQNVSFVFTNPATMEFVSGRVVDFKDKFMTFFPDFPLQGLGENNSVSGTLKIGENTNFVKAVVLENNVAVKFEITAGI